MTKGTKTYQWYRPAALPRADGRDCYLYGQDRPCRCQTTAKKSLRTHCGRYRKVPDSLDALSDPILQRVSTADSLAVADSIAAENKKRLLEMTSAPTPQVPDTPADSLNKELNKKVFIPNPTKATWLALVIRWWTDIQP